MASLCATDNPLFSQFAPKEIVDLKKAKQKAEEEALRMKLDQEVMRIRDEELAHLAKEAQERDQYMRMLQEQQNQPPTDGQPIRTFTHDSALNFFSRVL